MAIKQRNFSSALALVNLVVLVAFLKAPSVSGFQVRKLDGTTGDPGQKCTPCTQYPPPSPPPPLVLPPPPPPPSPPPPKKPSSTNCPPPPATPSIIYMTGPPGDLYPIDNSYSGGGRSILVGLPALLSLGLSCLLLIW